MSCKEQTSKTYTSRPSPSIKAKDCPNQTREGNDGTSYISTPNKNGVFRWVKEKTISSKDEDKPKPKPGSKECKPGQERNPNTGRCKKVKSVRRLPVSEISEDKPKPGSKECKPGQERNPNTGRCKKVKSVRKVPERKPSILPIIPPRTPSVRRQSTPRTPSMRRQSTPRTPSVRRPSVKKTVRRGIIDRINPFKKVPLHDGHPALKNLQLEKSPEDRRSQFLPDGETPLLVRIPENPSRKDQFGFKAVFVPVFTRPVFNDWIFYDLKTNQFRQPTFGSNIGNKFMPEEEVLDHIFHKKSESRSRVFVVNGDFGEFSRDSEFL